MCIWGPIRVSVCVAVLIYTHVKRFNPMLRTAESPKLSDAGAGSSVDVESRKRPRLVEVASEQKESA